MAIELDHLIVSARDARAAARRLGELLDVPWAETGIGPFSPVYLNDGLTIDFIDDPAPFPMRHLCFRVDDARFDYCERSVAPPVGDADGQLRAPARPLMGEFFDDSLRLHYLENPGSGRLRSPGGARAGAGFVSGGSDCGRGFPARRHGGCRSWKPPLMPVSAP